MGKARHHSKKHENNRQRVVIATGDPATRVLRIEGGRRRFRWTDPEGRVVPVKDTALRY